MSPAATATTVRTEEIEQVFAAWIAATGRGRDRTVLTADRRRGIAQALQSHGLADCLASVRHIGESRWARGENDRGRRFDDLSHALGSAERIERWRDADSVEEGKRGRGRSGREALMERD